MELEAGYELDKAVAEACGFDFWDGIHDHFRHMNIEPGATIKRDGEDGIAWYPFRPSINWNDAMLAAEKCGLFESRSLESGNGWHVSAVTKSDCCECRSHTMVVNDDSIASHASGPMAISLAILKLKSATNG